MGWAKVNIRGDKELLRLAVFYGIPLIKPEEAKL